MNYDLEKIFESHSYDDICAIIRHGGGVCQEGDHNLSLFSWSRPTRGKSPPYWKDKPVTSIIVNRATLTPVVIGNPYILFDDYCAVTDACIAQKQLKITELYDAREIVVFYYGGQWWTTTEKSLNLEFPSAWSRTNRQVKDLWEEAIQMPPRRFFDNHNPSYIYVYALLHHDDRHVIDYSTTFGTNYAYIMLQTMRHMETLEIVSDIQPPAELKVLTPIPHADFSALDTQNKNENEVSSLLDITQAGIRITSGEMMVHLHTSSFRLYTETSDTLARPCGSEHYLGLYQKNAMDSYLNKFKAESFHTASDGTPYQIKGLIDSIFKVLTSEVLYLFKMLWDVRFGTSKEEYKDVYVTLPSEYKKVFYILRGIYFSKKVSASTTNKFVTIKTVYDMLKKMEPAALVRLIVERSRILSCPDQYRRLYSLLNDYHHTEQVNRASKVVEQAMFFIEKKAI